jgi:drug/metabolite transporter (DMT)-like permease
MRPANRSFPRSPAKWAVAVAFISIYLSWGTTYLAIKKGVEVFPPAIFGGCRVSLAGLILVAYLGLRGHRLRLPMREFLWTAFVGILMFVGGNGLLTLGEKISVASGVASILGATTPLWIALLELAWPWGDRLQARGWLGLFVGLGGVLLLLAPNLKETAGLLTDAGPWCILGSSFSWAVGSFVMRYRRIKASYLIVAAYQMIVGGGTLTLIGWGCGEFTELSIQKMTPASIYSFFHLLVFGSLVGFVAYIWLLGHVTATLAGSHAYVNPAVAVLAGWLVNGENITVTIAGGMVIILLGVGLVRAGGTHPPKEDQEEAALRSRTAGSEIAGAAPAGLEGCAERV